MTQPDTHSRPEQGTPDEARKALDAALTAALPHAGGEIRTLITLLMNALAEHDARHGTPAPPVVVS